MSARTLAVLLLLGAGGGARAFDAPARLLVVHKWADTVGVYDAASGAKLASIPVGRKPHEIALSADRKTAWVTDYGLDRYTEDVPGGHTLTVLDLVAFRKTGSIDLGTHRRPHGIERGASGRLYVTVDQPPALLVIDPVAGRVERVLELPGQKLPHMVAVTRDERTAWTANAGSAAASFVPLDGRSGIRHVAVGGVPMGVVLSPDESRVFVTTRTGNAVAVIDAARVEKVGEIGLPGQPVRMRFVPDGRRLLVTLIEAGDVAVVDARSLAVLQRFHVGAATEGIQVDPVEGVGYASAQGDDRVVKFGLDDYRVRLQVATESRPDPIEVLR